jgi:predicted heme/steroid binding protein
MAENRLFTREELSQYNGSAGVPVLVACHGKVYDVTGSFLWQKGRHQATHTAGNDLSDSIKDAPHGEDMLERYPVVGFLPDNQ